ncbi:MAG: hypothetical protein R3F56_06745 [Planctomycetota bacterium]
MLRTAVAISLAPTLCAQTYIVDASNGPGTHFTDLPAAVSSVPDGASLRVRPGQYSQFVITAKSLSILGDSEASVRINAQSGSLITVRALAPAQQVVIRDVGSVQTYGPGAQIVVEDCAGAVTFDTCTIAHSVSFFGYTAQPALQVRRSTNVHLRRIHGASGHPDASVADACVEFDSCQFAGRDQTVAGAEGYAGLAVSHCRVSLRNCTIRGGAGGSDLYTSFGPGGPGLDAVDSTLDLAPGNSLTGGSGGIDPAGFGCYTIMASGGPGLRMRGSQARHANATIRGGDGPCAVCLTECTVQGPALNLTASSLAAVPSAPDLQYLGDVRQGGYVDLQLTAAPNELALLVLGFRPVCVSLPTIVDFGGILVSPELPFGPFVTDVHGAVSYRLALPPDLVLDRAVFAQYVTFPGAVLPGQGSNSVMFEARS